MLQWDEIESFGISSGRNNWKILHFLLAVHSPVTVDHRSSHMDKRHGAVICK